MSSFNPTASYVLGTACIGRGVMAIISPREEYAHVGLPLEPPKLTSPDQREITQGAVSPLMHFKGIREITFGLTLALLQQQGNDAAVTVFAAILSLARLGDGAVVWLNGGDKLRYRAWGHWITGAGFAGWVLWRRRY